jgi:hypothetical protein
MSMAKTQLKTALEIMANNEIHLLKLHFPKILEISSI